MLHASTHLEASVHGPTLLRKELEQPFGARSSFRSIENTNHRTSTFHLAFPLPIGKSHACPRSQLDNFHCLNGVKPSNSIVSDGIDGGECKKASIANIGCRSPCWLRCIPVMLTLRCAGPPMVRSSTRSRLRLLTPIVNHSARQACCRTSRVRS